MLFKSHRNEVCHQMHILAAMSHFLLRGRFFFDKNCENPCFLCLIWELRQSSTTPFESPFNSLQKCIRSDFWSDQRFPCNRHRKTKNHDLSIFTHHNLYHHPKRGNFDPHRSGKFFFRKFVPIKKTSIFSKKKLGRANLPPPGLIRVNNPYSTKVY